MALTQVRAKLGEEWVVLTYNEATGRYEGTVTPPGTSIHQPGGYYSIQTEALSDSGETASVSGEQLPSLRLVVREIQAPVLTLISPAPGWLNTASPVLVFEATDEEGGSGVDPESFRVNVGPGPLAGPTGQAESYEDDPPRAAGPTQAEGPTWEPIPNGYRFTWTPPGGWADGAHTVTASVADYDGNVSTVSAAYSVDTVPPEMLLREPGAHRIVDVDRVTVTVWASDGTSGVEEVRCGRGTIGALATAAGIPLPVYPGWKEWSFEVPLEIGENHIQVTARDRAGLETSLEVYMIRLVTDRTQEDVEQIKALIRAKHVQQWTEEELEWFNVRYRRGAYNAEDLNRVGVAVGYLAGELRKRGFLAGVSPKTDWARGEPVKRGQGAAYLRDVETVRSAQGLYVEARPPATMRFTPVIDWNAIEKALVESDAWLERYAAPWTAGEISCGEV